MEHWRIQFDKVVYIVIGSFILLPALVFYVWATLSEWFQYPETTGLILTITLAIVIGILVGLFVNPMIAYKRNSDICVGGIPFPIHYGMPVEDGCISGYVAPLNFILDVCYFCLVFMAMGLLVYTNGAKYGFTVSFTLALLLFIVVKAFLVDVLNIYPINIKVAE